MDTIIMVAITNADNLHFVQNAIYGDIFISLQ